MPSLILTLAGPTAVGKTELSLRLADQLGAEIISADSRQVYRGLDIGTAKPSPEELARAPHHFVDELDLGDSFSAGAFARQAEARIREIIERGRVPLVVGGSTLYLHALQHGIADIPTVDPAVRAALEKRMDDEGASTLYAELTRIDPQAAATLDATKTQRLLRALEIYHGTGKTRSWYQARHQPPAFRYRTLVLQRPRAELYQRINQRVEQMLQRGLLGEVRGLLARGVDPRLNPLRTIGYQEPIAFLQGEIDEAEMVRLLKRNSRRYAKRQLTWFRRFPDYEWVNAQEAYSLLQ